MSDNTLNALQANFKTPAGSLFNIYGQTPEQFEWHLKAFTALVSDLLAAEALVSGATPSAISTVQAVFPGATVVTQTGTVSQPQVSQPAAPAANNGAPACRHGAMVWVAPANKPWKGWFCPQPKDATDKCPPQFAKG